ncbi:hypothetical protein ACP70R_048161 [Stipagrostis hirtigluma subsp. patula]
MAMASAPARSNKRAKLAAPVTLADDGVLPTDVLSEVLLRLPAKALCRLRLVCRSWRSLTSDPEFAKAHSSRHLLAVGLRFRSGTPDRDIHFLDLSGNIVKRMSLTDCSPEFSVQRGLLCLLSENRSHVSVLNPATGAVSALPDDIAVAHDGILGDDSWTTCVLGHVPITGSYKVLRIHSYLPIIDIACTQQVCEVITLGDGDLSTRWRAKPGPSICVAMDSRDIAVVNGVACFLFMTFGIGDRVIVEPDGIALFDLATEEWRPVTLRGPLSTNLSDTDKKLPYQRHRKDLQLRRLDGCLVTVHHNRQDCSMGIWFLEDMDKGLWIKRHSISYMPDCKYDQFILPYPMTVLKDGRIVIWVQRKQVLAAYDPKTGTLADLANVDDYCAVGMLEGSLLSSRVPS